MTNPRNPDRPESPQVEVVRLVNGMLDGTYKNIEEAQIALEKSRLSRRWSPERAANDDIAPHP
jgi:hypothetical protein